jgi:MoaA/NifB/PqqE/SkfB family radical SAM enzyme
MGHFFLCHFPDKTVIDRQQFKRQQSIRGMIMNQTGIDHSILEKLDSSGVKNGLDFLWLELTNRCNLQCVHCYTESHPNSGQSDLLKKEDYEAILEEGYGIGCRKVQFIGGEPQLNRDFKYLLQRAKQIGYEFIEVFSNLNRLDAETISFSADNDICFATSIYADIAASHDAITKTKGSFARTVGNLKKLIAQNITTRAAVIVIDQDDEEIRRTNRFLQDLGVGSLRVGPLREFGRGEQILSQPARLSGLCGHCWRGKLAIAPDGIVYPCVMARQWSVGDVFQSSLSEIISGEALKGIRQTIFDSIWLPKIEGAMCFPQPGCHPHCPEGCAPDGCPESPCPPELCPESCTPDGCEPSIACEPHPA